MDDKPGKAVKNKPFRCNLAIDVLANKPAHLECQSVEIGICHEAHASTTFDTQMRQNISSSDLLFVKLWSMLLCGRLQWCTVSSPNLLLPLKFQYNAKLMITWLHSI